MSKIAYKATDKNMRCREKQYGFDNLFTPTGRIELLNTSFTPQENKQLQLCSDQVIHYCNKVEGLHQWYNSSTDRYFKVEILGDYVDGTNKSGTTLLRFIEELNREDIEKQRQAKKLHKKLQLDKVQALQARFEHIILGGSTALYLQGAKLKRLEIEGVSDLDLIHPFFVDLSEMDGINHIDAKNSGNTFDETLEYNGLKLDLSISPECKYKIVEYEGHKYKVNPVENILEYKVKYAQQKNGEKHRRDIYELLEILK